VREHDAKLRAMTNICTSLDCHKHVFAVDFQNLHFHYSEAAETNINVRSGSRREFLCCVLIFPGFYLLLLHVVLSNTKAAIVLIYPELPDADKIIFEAFIV